MLFTVLLNMVAVFDTAIPLPREFELGPPLQDVLLPIP